EVGVDVRQVDQPRRGKRDVQVVDQEQGDLRRGGGRPQPGEEQRDGRAAVERRGPARARRGRGGRNLGSGESGWKGGAPSNLGGFDDGAGCFERCYFAGRRGGVGDEGVHDGGGT